jgi:hypothetical protein
MVEYPDCGAVVLQTYLDPREYSSDGNPSHKDADTIASATTDDDKDLHQLSDDAAPMLVGVVVAASSDEAREARRAAVRLERVGREFQKEWTAQAERGAADPGAD